MTQSCQLLSLAALSAICAAYARNMDGSGLRIQDQQGQQYSYHGGDDLPISTPGLARPAPIFPHAPAQPPSGFIALGDSYSAGIGTGFNGTEHPCRLGLHAHPVLLYQDLLELVAPNESSFQFLSCTGSTVEDMLQGSERSQIDEFNTSTTADFALLSVGGNDLGFFDIMNSCIFRFFSFYSGTCGEALRKSEAALAGPNLRAASAWPSQRFWTASTGKNAHGSQSPSRATRGSSTRRRGYVMISHLAFGGAVQS